MDDPNPNPTTRVPTPSLGPSEDDAAIPPSSEPTVAAAPPPPPAEPTFAAAPSPPPSWGSHRRDRGDAGRIWTLVVGLSILGVGLWFFLERTLGLDLPTIRWSTFWPVILIAIGVVVLLGALRRERR
jgi:hypothetical protein